MGSKTTSIRIGDRRERLFDRLEDATGEATRAGALEAAARYFCHMEGASYEGAVEKLLERAIKEGNLTPEEIAETIDHDTLPIQISVDVEIGIGN